MVAIAGVIWRWAPTSLPTLPSGVVEGAIRRGGAVERAAR